MKDETLERSSPDGTETISGSSRREVATQRIREGDHIGALHALLNGLPANPSMSETNLILRITEKLDHSQLSLVSSRVALLGSFTLDTLGPLLKIKGYQAGIKIEVHIGEFNTWQIEGLNPNSTLYEFNPDIVFLLIRPEEICPAFLVNSMALSLDEKKGEIARVEKEIRAFL